VLNLKVGELEEYLAKRQESTVTAKLNEFSTDDEATELRVQTGFSETTTFALDETATLALAKYLKVPGGYLRKVTPDFRAEILNYEFTRHQDVTTSVESMAGNLVSVHQPTQTMLPLSRVGEVITKVMTPEDTIRRVLTDDQRFHLDVTTASQVATFPTPEGVGDITEGGIRVLAYPFQTRKPSVAAYLERLICTNGMVQEERFGAITLKGRTVDEVILEMEDAANQVLGSLDEHLKNYADTRHMAPPGSPQAFAAQLAREANVSRRVLDAILDRINQLPEPVSIWDVNQAFTTVANELSYANMVRLQTVGGNLAINAEEMARRCGTCERRLS
jgi:hypothetical protein